MFAGVGGFRVGLNKVKLKDGIVEESNDFDFVWANQYEPKRKKQVAYNIYKERFGECDNRDICTVDKSTIPNHDLLVAGFPCQDYSVANFWSDGLDGNEGVLWWEIYDTLKAKKPKYALFENVDYLLKSPSHQRGRDFAVLLYSLWDLGYDVEWRYINAADYCFPQRRRRVFIFAYRDEYHSMFDECFPAEKSNFKKCSLIDFKDIVDVSENFEFLFGKGGLMEHGIISTFDLKPKVEDYVLLEDILDNNVDEKYIIKEDKLKRIKQLKGKDPRPKVMEDGSVKNYWQGAVPFPDYLDRPARTIITSEANTNRSTHVIEQDGVFRTLTPSECEKIQTFPKGWTDLNTSDRERYFVMGNALVCGVVERIGEYFKEYL